jgi:hypothetical protein
MTTTHRITATTAVLLSLAAAGAQAANARPADFAPASHQSPASVYSRPDKAMIPRAAPVTGSSSTPIPPILPRITASQLAATEQTDRQAAAYTPPKGSPYRSAELSAYAAAVNRHVTPGVVVLTRSHTGFDWGDAGIGAVGGLALAMLGVGGGLVISHQRPRRTRPTTTVPS